VSIWKTPQTLAAINAQSVGTLIGHLGIVYDEIGDDYLCATMPVDERTRQPYGLLHGGASVVLAESLGSMAANLAVDRATTLCVGQEINANHVRSARSGVVRGVTRPVHLGARSQVWSIEIFNAAKALVCISRLTMAVMKTSVPMP
jgi:1,4-dihydroxy-2-naphthoyl-CoA hydrolase